MAATNPSRVRLNPPDLERLAGMGIGADRIQEQVEIFEKGVSPIRLVRPATEGDGVLKLPESEVDALAGIYIEKIRNLRVIKFVPASGAATRMFRVLHQYLGKGKIIESAIRRDAATGDPDAGEMLEILEGLKNGVFAFSRELTEIMERNGVNFTTVASGGDMTVAIEYLLKKKGLNYENLPKALLRFHKYNGESRTALEEHLAEGCVYARDSENRVRLHFTVSPEHLEGFKAHVDLVCPKYENGEGRSIEFQVEYSEQKSKTNTIAVDPENQLFRDSRGSLVLRAGGHGALLENLGELDADIVFIKNIDNVAPDWLKGETHRYKKALGGLLLTIREKVFSFLDELETALAAPERLAEMADYARGCLNIELSSQFPELSPLEKTRLLFSVLNRPIRVCGMVKNQGEPGGGPFWTENADGLVSLQIVEAMQIDKDSPAQMAIARRATYFNPVDVVCSIRDYKGKKFDLSRYVDNDTCFIATKSHEGRPIKALELPGLWNGAMAGWITVFIETPLVTFSPIKSISDLLRKEHLPIS